MKEMAMGALGTLILVGVGTLWWQGRAQIEQEAPPPPEPQLMEAIVEPEVPVSDPGNLRGPAPPEATELTKEQRRFFRYDRNRDLRITRNEMLSSRTKAFRKLDKDGNNLLTFEEWAVRTVDRFEKADANGNRSLTAAEFATTRPKRKAKKKTCKC